MPTTILREDIEKFVQAQKDTAPSQDTSRDQIIDDIKKLDQITDVNKYIQNPKDQSISDEGREKMEGVDGKIDPSEIPDKDKVMGLKAELNARETAEEQAQNYMKKSGKYDPELVDFLKENEVREAQLRDQIAKMGGSVENEGPQQASEQKNKDAKPKDKFQSDPQNPLEVLLTAVMALITGNVQPLMNMVNGQGQQQSETKVAEKPAETPEPKVAEKPTETPEPKVAEKPAETPEPTAKQKPTVVDLGTWKDDQMPQDSNKPAEREPNASSKAEPKLAEATEPTRKTAPTTQVIDDAPASNTPAQSVADTKTSPNQPNARDQKNLTRDQADLSTNATRAGQDALDTVNIVLPINNKTMYTHSV